MSARLAVPLVLVALTTALVPGPPQAEAPREFRPFEIYVLHTLSTASASAHGSETGRDSGATLARAVSSGREHLGDCHGRLSGADAVARSATQERRDWAASLLLSATARANGGHYLEGPCLLRQGHDTSAESEARAEGTLQVRFLEDAGDAPYEIRLKGVWIGEHSEGARFSARLVDPEGKVAAEGPQWRARVTAAPYASYTVALSLQSRAADKGACCSSSSQGSLRAELEVIRSPGLARGLEKMQQGGPPHREERHATPPGAGGGDLRGPHRLPRAGLRHARRRVCGLAPGAGPNPLRNA